MISAYSNIKYGLYNSEQKFIKFINIISCYNINKIHDENIKQNTSLDLIKEFNLIKEPNNERKNPTMDLNTLIEEFNELYNSDSKICSNSKNKFDINSPKNTLTEYIESNIKTNTYTSENLSTEQNKNTLTLNKPAIEFQIIDIKKLDHVVNMNNNNIIQKVSNSDITKDDVYKYNTTTEKDIIHTDTKHKYDNSYDFCD
jgi:hypothetical protein